MNSKKAMSFISLAMKAGRIVSGEFASGKAIKSGEAALVILSEDASANTEKKFSNMASWNEVPMIRFLSKTELGRLMGRGDRSCAVVIDENFAAQIRKNLEEPHEERPV